MAWESRRNKSYYYRKRKVGGKVISEYVGSGFLADYAEGMDERAKAEAARKRKEWEAIKDEQRRLDKIVDDFTALVNTYTDALMLVTGHHTHKRQWRKERSK